MLLRVRYGKNVLLENTKYFITTNKWKTKQSMFLDINREEVLEIYYFLNNRVHGKGINLRNFYDVTHRFKNEINGVSRFKKSFNTFKTMYYINGAQLTNILGKKYSY